MKTDEKKIWQEGNDNGYGVTIFWFLIFMAIGIGVMIGTTFSMLSAIIRGGD